MPPFDMRRPYRLLALCALSVSLVPASGCKRTRSSESSPGSTGSVDDAPARPKRVRRKPGLPRPLRLPAQAPLIVHIQQPGDAIAGLRAYSPQLPGARELLTQAVTQVPGAGEFESALAEAADLERSWDAVSIDGELIVHVPIIASQVERVAGLLANKPPVGRFGAVDLQRSTGPAPKLAWLDREAKALTLANSERGLATGRQLAREYGKEHRLRLTLSGAEARKYAPAFALEQLDLEGAGPHRFELTAKGVPPEVFAQLDKLDAGALTGLLESPRIALGASSKYANYDQDVRRILGNVKRQVDRQNFLVKGTLQDLSRRLGSVMRSWNGRTMVGVGPKSHVLLGLGAEDPKRMGGALFHLTTGVIDNLSLARSIGVSVPKIRFQRNKNAAAGSNISVIALESARKYLPPEAAALVNDRGDLRIAVAFPSRAGAGLVVLGPDCHNVMARWLEDIAEATPAADSAQDFIAATAAVDPKALEPLLQPGGNVASLLGLDASREPTRLRVTRDGDTVTMHVEGPRAAPRVRRFGARRTGHRSRTPTQPSASGKPARIVSGKSKPIR
ncbi:MAG: hypothetical protein AAGF11_00780 [Myxococcota bacterium]